MFFRKNWVIPYGEKLSEIPNLYGTYRGSAPTDVPASPIGELEVIIDATKIKISHATGQKIDVREFQHNELRRLSKSEIQGCFPPDSSVTNSSVVDKIIGFQFGEQGLIFLFTPIVSYSNALGLIIKGQISDVLGLTIALGPKHIVSRGMYNQIMKMHGMAMIANDGKPSVCCPIM